jgi:hypothetical protein
MTAQTKIRRGFWQNLLRRDAGKTPEEIPTIAQVPRQEAPELEIAPNDPILAYLASVSGGSRSRSWTSTPRRSRR